nr:Omp28-related outer membrane protein [uncultured Dyadobacter sp.]
MMKRMQYHITRAVALLGFIATALGCTSGGSQLDDVPPAGDSDGIAAGVPGKDFVKNVLIWEFTTTDCKFCPYIKRDIANVQALEDVGSRIFAAIIHGKLVEADPFRFARHTELERQFGVTGAYPSTIIDHDDSYRQRGAYSTPNITKDYLGKALNAAGKAGLKLVSKVDGRAATLQVKLKTNEAASYKIAALVLESALPYPQYLPEPPGIDSGYVHNHVLRAFLTDLFGDAAGELKAGDELTKTFTYTIPPDYNSARLELLVYVLRDGKAVNSQFVKAGNAADYQFTP